jgi:hypothetical protein
MIHDTLKLPTLTPSLWHWHVEPVPRGARCAQCQQPLRGADGLVRWCDASLYHVGCLLDRLSYREPLLQLPSYGDGIDSYTAP